jgi:hypothetical protein
MLGYRFVTYELVKEVSLVDPVVGCMILFQP